MEDGHFLLKDFVETEGVFRKCSSISDSLYANSRTHDIGKVCCLLLRHPLPWWLRIYGRKNSPINGRMPGSWSAWHLL